MKDISVSEMRFIDITIKELGKISKRINRLDCASCNGEVFDDAYQRKLSLQLNKAKNLASRIGKFVYHQPDPRGCSLHLLDSLENADMIYTRGVSL